MSAGNPDQKVYVYAVFSSLIRRRRWTQFWGAILAAFGALSVANPLPPSVTRPRYAPLSRDRCSTIPLSHCVSCGIADYRCYTPTCSSKSGLSRSKDRPNKRVSQTKLVSEAYRAIGGVARNSIANRAIVKNLLTPLFLMSCFPVDFQEAKRPLRAKSVKRPIKVGKRPINEGKRPIKARVLVGISAGCLMGCFRASRPWWKTAPLKRPIKRSMI